MNTLKCCFQKSRSLLVILLILVSSSFSYAEGAGKTSYASGGKSMNVRFSPLGMLIGYINVDMDFTVNENWTAGPSGSYWSLEASDPAFANKIKTTAYAIGARANWYLDGVYQSGMYVSPMLQLVGAKATVNSGGVDYSASVSTFALSGLVGYHWFWDTFNMNLGGGISMLMGTSKASVTAGTSKAEVDVRSSGSTGLAIDFMMGFAF